MNDSLNIACLLRQLSEEIPDQPAVMVPRGNTCRQINFLDLEEDSNRLAQGLSGLGISRGDRVLLMVPPGIDFISLTFSLFKIGAVPVLIDPGLGRKNILQCVRDVEPQGLIGIAKAHLARCIYREYFQTIRVCVTVGRRWFWGGGNLRKLRHQGEINFVAVDTSPDDPAAILFTSGSTGPPKGVVYTHRMFFRQVEILSDHFGFKRGEADLATFPLFALFSAALGLTCVIPDMNPTRPASVNPERIIRAVEEFSVSTSFGSPALWDTVTRFCLERKITLPGIKRILIAGAPVPGTLLQSFEHILDDDSEIHTPYGATEALPVSSITHQEILRETWSQTKQGLGICVGKPVPGITVKIIKITDGPILAWDPYMELLQGEIGEIVVQGPWVTREYFHNETAGRLAKIPDGDTFWHRMGDVGYLDEKNRLWFCGRKSQRVLAREGTLYTIPCEAIFNQHPKVRRAALVGIGSPGNQEPVIIIEGESKEAIQNLEERERLSQDLLALGAPYPHTKIIRRVLFYPSFPVDIRHNAKIFREQLAAWATEQIRKEK